MGPDRRVPLLTCLTDWIAVAVREMSAGQRHKTFAGAPDAPGPPPTSRITKAFKRDVGDDPNRRWGRLRLGSFQGTGVGRPSERFAPLARKEPRTATHDPASQVSEEGLPTPVHPATSRALLGAARSTGSR